MNISTLLALLARFQGNALFLSMCSGIALAQNVASLPNLTISKGGTMTSMVEQADGKLITGGAFLAVNEFPRNNLARVNPNGTVDMGGDPCDRSRLGRRSQWQCFNYCLVRKRRLSRA